MPTTTQASALTSVGGALTPILLTAHVDANTKPTGPGAYTTLLSSLSAPTSALIVQVGLGSPVRSTFLIDVAEGATDGETPFLSNLLFCNGNGTSPMMLFLCPKSFSAGTRISARCQSDGSDGVTAATVRIHVLAIQGDWSAPAIASLTTIGANTGNSGGIAVPPGNNAKGSPWTEIEDALIEDVDGFFVAVGDRGVTDQVTAYALLDLGTGAASSEVVQVPDILVGSDTGERLEPRALPFIPLALVAGTRVAARMASSSTVPVPFDVVLYAVRYVAPSTGGLLQPVVPNG